jgi:hypothetical protein
MLFRVKMLAAVLFLGLIAVFISSMFIIFEDPDDSFEEQYNSMVNPYVFNIASWEIQTLYQQAKLNITDPPLESSLTSESVQKYFSLIELQLRLKSDLKLRKETGNSDLVQLEAQTAILRPIVEKTLKQQISQTLAEQGIYNPVFNTWLKLNLPPVNFVLENPPHLLIVSPRNRIERILDSVLVQDMSLEQIEKLEASLEELNISVLVEEIGGLGATYPSFVQANSSLRFTINTALEEWLHQYLAFKPLGFRYVLDLLNVSTDNDIPTLNETVASMISKELGWLVFATYYSREPDVLVPSQNNPPSDIFNFNQQMREIRIKVDNYLALGQIDEAEQYMKEKREVLESKGYYIRKLNQAYFAFYGSYADSPTSVDPIGEDLRLLRKYSPSIKDFLDIASTLRTRQDLNQAVSSFK